MRLRVVPITLKAARRWIAQHHSYLGAPQGGLLAVSVEADGRRCCVAVMEIPKARLLMNGTTAELSRVASDGTTRHAASKAGMALVRALTAIGYERFVSATLLGEPGTMFRAMGWWPTSIINAAVTWGRRERPRHDAAQPGRKIRWEFGPAAAPRSQEAEDALRGALGQIRSEKHEHFGPLFEGIA